MSKRRTILTLVLSCFAGLGSVLATAETRFFPPKAFDFPGFPELDGLFDRHYTEQLLGLKELPLWNVNLPTATYRVTWLRSFDRPMSFRLTYLRDGTSELVVKMADGKGGYDPGKLSLNKAIQLDFMTTRELLDDLESLGFWSLATQSPEKTGLDGASWILEGSESGTYHVVHRWSGDEIRDWCLKLMRLSGVELGRIY